MPPPNHHPPKPHSESKYSIIFPQHIVPANLTAQNLCVVYCVCVCVGCLVARILGSSVVCPPSPALCPLVLPTGSLHGLCKQNKVAHLWQRWLAQGTSSRTCGIHLYTNIQTNIYVYIFLFSRYDLVYLLCFLIEQSGKLVLGLPKRNLSMT